MEKIWFILFLVFHNTAFLDTLKDSNYAKSTMKDFNNLGIHIQFNYINGMLDDDLYCFDEPFFCPLSVGFYKSFDEKELWYKEDTADIQWAIHDGFDNKIPYWIYVYWEKYDEEGIIDKENKSLCYTFGYGCFFPYNPHIKVGAEISSSISFDNTISTFDENDIGFIIAQSNDVYQIIIFKNYKEIIAQIQETIKTKKIKRYDSSLKYNFSNVVINGFIGKDSLKEPFLGHHRYYKIDPYYNNKLIFSTPPQNIKES
ncbi:hypothetical protein CQA53_00600 [Helicobacter didelphidarum]|uniref:Uncharacterized protein n=1 Tax=Helicobacter didelphidarum TaxID=2040648 RepID=A0A3D8IRE6_9HELI|nr:hypothetical protein [Helicobacter didelphidarum]RDU67550.1 hypothetical protein CQA53_00600 [Helicobacter didelphidarum]